MSFNLECPHCGSINSASTFFLSRKVIQCCTCGKEINTKQSRMISKVCSNCGQVFIYDQKKPKDPKCPHCGQAETRTYHYDNVSVRCPQCGCGIEAGKGETAHPCPLCGCRIHVANEYAKQQLVEKNEVSIISWEGDNTTLIRKHPIEDFNIGSQLIVHESQEAVLFLNGQALDSFGAGRYALDSENIPVLRRIFELPKDDRTPFHCEVYFINKTVQLGLKWGTPDRIKFIEPLSGMPMDLGACGELNLQVTDGRKLLMKLVGTTGGLNTRQVLDAAGEGEQIQTLRSFFRAPLVMAVKNHLAQTIKDRQINILEIDTHLTDLSAALQERIAPSFAEFGLSVPNFYITAVSLPEDDANFREMKQLISDKWLRVQKTKLETDVKREERSLIREEQENKLLEQRYAIEQKRLEMELKAETVERMGLAEGRAKAAQGYNKLDELRHEEQLAFAGALGQIGANGGSGGGLTSDLLGLVVGAKAVGSLGQQIGGMMDSFTAPQPPAVWACACGAKNPLANSFCDTCGNPKPTSWDCPCGKTGNTNKFCGACGSPRPTTWDCPCGQTGNTENFCESCGKPKPTV